MTNPAEKPSLIVMKFGGTCLATAELRAQAIASVREHVDAGRRLVVVVSAMGRAGEPYSTDTLKGLPATSAELSTREADALLSCGEQISACVFAAELQGSGVPALSLRGFQAGIVTDETHGDATILEIRPTKIREHLEEGRVVVVTGFQGISLRGEVTTLGRGGSDTTAVALAAALGADCTEIVTDVDGVMTADPRSEPDARPVAEMTHREAAELARRGAKVLHPRAAGRARASKVPVHIRSVTPGQPSTWLVSEEGRWSPGRDCAPRTTSVTSMSGIAQVVVEDSRLVDHPAGVAQILGAIARAGISLDMFSISPGRVAFTLEQQRAAEVREILQQIGFTAKANLQCAKITLVGGGIHGIPGVMHRMVAALAAREITIRQSVDSNTILSVLIDASKEEDAVHALHIEFFG